MNAWTDRIKLTFSSGRVGAGSSASLRRHLLRLGYNSRVRARTETGDFTVTIPNNGYFSAQLQFRQQLDRTDPCVWKLVTTLEINATRFFLAETCGRDLDTLPRSLDRQNNWVPDDLTARARAVDWNEIVQSAILSAIRQIESIFLLRPLNPLQNAIPDDAWEQANAYPRSLRLSATLSRRTVTFEFNWNVWAVSQLETYFEYAIDDAITAVHNLNANAQEIVAGINVTEYPIGYPSFGSDLNAISLSIPLGRRTINLVVYAKSTDRIRLEVRHLSNVKSAYRHLGAVRSISTRNFHGLFDILSIAREQSNVRARQMLQAIWTRDIRTGASMLRLAMFLSHVTNACGGSQTLIQRVLASLVIRGMLVNDGSGELSAALETLTRNGVLMRVRSRVRNLTPEYSCTRTYGDLLDHLRAQLPLR